MGARDQGHMFGYATDEWDNKTLHPYFPIPRLNQI